MCCDLLLFLQFGSTIESLILNIIGFCSIVNIKMYFPYMRSSFFNWKIHYLRRGRVINLTRRARQPPGLFTRLYKRVQKIMQKRDINEIVVYHLQTV